MPNNTIETSSGLLLDVLEPDLSSLTLEEIAHSLHNLCRFNGHCSRHYSVLSHSVNCAIVAECLGYSLADRCRCFTHDFGETIISDLANPIKPYLPDYRDLEEKIDKKFLERFDISGDYAKMRAVDYAMAKLEAFYLMPCKGQSDRWHRPEVDITPFADKLYGLGKNLAASIDVFLWYANQLGIK